MRRPIGRFRVHRAWADVGSHGGIFFFESGLVGDRYPGLLHIFKDKVTPDLIEVEIRQVKKARGLGMPGMSLRDYFAGMALQGMLANQSINIEKSDLCGDAFDFADRMIERRKR